MQANKNLCTLYLVRHGETDWNLNGVVQGHIDIPLNATGRQQAIQAAKNFTGITFSAAYTSDLARAKETAEIIAAEHQLAVAATTVLRERKLGHFEGKSVEFLREELAKASENINLELKETRARWRAYEDIESDEEMATRIITYLREISLAHPSQNVLIGTHSGVLRVLLLHLGYFDYKESENIQIANAGYIKLESDGIDFFVKDVHGIKSRA